MFDALREAIDGLDVPATPDGVVALAREIDRLHCLLVDGIAAVDATGAWADRGATSLTAWLRHEARLSGADAARLVRTARTLRHLPVTADAWRDQALAGGQVAAITVALRPATVPVFADHEPALIPTLAPLSVAQTANAMRHWQAAAEATVDPAPPPEDCRELWLNQTLDGIWHLRGTLDAEGGALLERALGVATTLDVAGAPKRSGARRRADALIDVAAFTLGHHPRHAGRRRTNLEVIVQHQDLQTNGPGRIGTATVPHTVIQRLACDALLRVVTVDGIHPLRYGTAQRTVPWHLYRAAALRDQHCRFPSCDRPVQWCDAHHVTPYPHGPTDLDNLALLCRWHHTLLHRPGWHAKLLPDATLHITTPDGTALTSHPPPRPP